jgi:hypothetical protein
MIKVDTFDNNENADDSLTDEEVEDELFSCYSKFSFMSRTLSQRLTDSTFSQSSKNFNNIEFDKNGWRHVIYFKKIFYSSK